MSDTTSIAMPTVYRDASTSGLGAVAAAAESVRLTWLVVGFRVRGKSARGRESVARMTPDETTATATFLKRKEGAEGEGD